jgi:hypothetical protein
MTILIIEDETLASERLERLMHEIDPSINIIGKLKSIKDSILENPSST